MKGKKGTIPIAPLITLGLGIVILVISLTMGGYVLSKFKTAGNFAANSLESNITTQGQQALSTMSGFVGILAIIGIVIVILGALFAMMVFKQS